MHTQLLSAQSRNPRALLLEKGAKSLSIKDLLMVMFGTGTKNVPVHRIAQSVEELLLHSSLKKLSIEYIQKIPGLGNVQTCRLLAMLELTDRLHAHHTQTFSSPSVIATYLHDLSHESTENLVCLYLNGRLELELYKTIAVGSLNQVILTPRDIFFPVQQYPISHIVLAHNHPTNTLEPSSADLQFTARMKEAAALLGITLEDHLIVGKSGWYSFREHDLL